MSDPAVCSFLTKVLCAHGGGAELGSLPGEVGLPEAQLKQLLEEAGSERYLSLSRGGGSAWVLALTAARLCVKQVCPDGCERLHLCKQNLRGRCRARACKYSHDILSEDNRKVLKNHELSGLNENELRVLLLQNDPFLLPDVCNAYNKGEASCDQQDNCPKLHICRYFLKGQCRFPRCKRSHCLMDPKALKLLLAEGVDNEMAFNIQTICNYKTTALARELVENKCFYSKPKPTLNQEKSGNQSKSALEQTSGWNTSMNIDPSQDVKTTHCSRTLPNAEKEKIDEICLYYLFQFCKHKNNCNMFHYHLPYRWQVDSGNGWNDLPNGGEIEKAYCDPSFTSILDSGIDFGTMTSSTGPIRRLSTPSSVTKPAKFVMTTKWLWYWKNDKGQWIEYGKQDGTVQGSSICSDDLENVFLADPKGSIQFQADSQFYDISFKDMTQMNVLYQTKREVRRRPKFVSSQDVKTKKGHTAHSAPVLHSAPLPAIVPLPSPNYPSLWDKSALPSVGFKITSVNRHTTHSDPLLHSAPVPAIVPLPSPNYPSLWDKSALPSVGSKVTSVNRHTAHSAPVLHSAPVPAIVPLPSLNYPGHWDKSALPSIGFKAVELTKGLPEYIKIETLFEKTMSKYVVQRIRRIQNPSLWEIFQWQKDQMKKKNGGQNVDERLLFHGTHANTKTICSDNFDWRICGTNGTVFGKGSYFARDARYSHNYCQRDGKTKVMFVAQVLVGSFIVGNANYSRPPAKSTGTLQYYDSCVDNMIYPSIFVIFEKHQIYPAYMIDYSEEEKKCILS